ncbi:Peroxisomal membrane protein PMP27 [Blyttiomyces sp. JEL0837]|nr:Peroxisomal membrane protein PMP27 [Blyttiomyces sp. JEL0837]
MSLPILLDPELGKDRVFGYTYYAGTVYAIACGYFVWDTVISIIRSFEHGPGMVIHGVSCLTVYGLCFKPFLMYYGAVFLMFELRQIFWKLSKNPHIIMDVAALSPLIVDSYEGNIENGVYDGDGKLLFKSGQSYDGHLNRGFMSGTGSFKWRDGVEYEGNFERNRIVGHGTYTWKNGSKYVGELRDGLRSGKGTWESTSTPLRYEGQWENGKFHGPGLLVYDEARSSFYEGEWCNGLKHGQGMMQYASGNVYQGEWVNDVKCGQGKMTWKERGEEYVGMWKDGLPHGKGVFTWKACGFKHDQYPLRNRYEGEWEEGKRSGQGVFQYASGAKYCGEWKDNVKHGFGYYISENGRRYIGEFKNDRAVGEWPGFQNDAPYQFNFALSSLKSGGSDDDVKRVNVVILRHIHKLRDIYVHYCGAGRTTKDELQEGAMTRIDLWKLLIDCKLKKKGYTLVDMDRAFARIFHSDTIIQHFYKDPHNPRQQLIFRDFLDALIRIAHMIYGGRKDISLYEHGVEACLSYLIKTDLLPNAMTIIEPAQPVTELDNIRNDLMQKMDELYSNRIFELYLTLSGKHSNSLQDSEGDKTITIREFLFLLMEIKLLDVKGDPAILSRVIEIFATDLPAVADSGCYNLEFEIVPYEFMSAIFACAWIKADKLIRNYLRSREVNLGVSLELPSPEPPSSEKDSSGSVENLQAPMESTISKPDLIESVNLAIVSSSNNLTAKHRSFSQENQSDMAAANVSSESIPRAKGGSIEALHTEEQDSKDVTANNNGAGLPAEKADGEGVTEVDATGQQVEVNDYDHTVKFLSTTVGRDRINRFIQYFTRFVAWHLQRSGAEKDLLDRLAKLQGSVGQTRKLMRAGRQLEFYRAMEKSLNVKDDVVRITTLVKNFCLALWLAHDTFQWAHNAGVVKLTTIKEIGQRAFKFWLVALVASFIGDLHKLRLNAMRVGIETKAVKAAALKKEKDESAEKTLKALKSERSKIILATVQDGLDILIPASGLEYIKVETGLIGLAGAITSVIGGCE